MVRARLNILPKLIAKFIRDSGITQWKSVPSILVSMANHDLIVQDDFPQLRRIMWGGEAFPTAFLQHWMKRLPHVQFTNSYGPAEATIGYSFYTFNEIPKDDGEPLPIGKAVTGNKLMILDSAQQTAAVNQVGDLYVGGAGLSPGYWRDDALTNAAFQEIPAGSGERWYRTGDLARMDAAGVLHFCGRADRQIKSRGYRIELDDVAIALSRITSIAESTVVAIAGDEFVGNQICAAYVMRGGVTLSPIEIKTILASSLPIYMLPHLWMELEILPKSPNGKVDHSQIEHLFLEK